MSMKAPMRKMKVVALALAVLSPVVALGGERGCPAYSPTLGCIHPGMVVMGQPRDLPKGWRAYPLSIHHDGWIILPWRYETRMNFRLAREKRRREARRRDF